MSINITVHGNKVNTGKHKKCFGNPEHLKKQELEEYRKTRLQQVREKSKEIASQLRNNVKRAEIKHLEELNDVKRRELLKWREKAAEKVQKQFEEVLDDIGKAHEAAELETLKNSKRNLSLGNRPIKRIAPPKCINLSKDRNKRKNITVVKPKILRNKENLQKFSSNNSSNSSDLPATQKQKNSHTSFYSPYHTSPESDLTLDSDTDSPSNDTIKSVQLPTTKANIDHFKINDSSASLSDISNIQSTSHRNHNYKSSQKSRISNLCKKTEKQKTNPKEKHQNIVHSINSPVIEKPIRLTQISDLIKQSQQKSESNVDFKSSINFSIKDAPILRRKSKSEELSHSLSSPIKSSESILLKRKSLSPTKKPIRSTLSPKKHQCNVQSLSPSKMTCIYNKSVKSKSSDSLPKQHHVQFFDYNNKFHKRYEPTIQSNVHSNNILYGLNAMQRAEIESELQEFSQEKLHRSREKANQRYQKAIEKEHVRKDYEDLKTKLEAISRDPELKKAIATNLQNNSQNKAILKQKRLNEEFEKVLKQQANAKYCDRDDIEKNNKFEDISESLNNSEKFANLLNSVSDQTKEITEDIANCKSLHDIKKLKELLDSINELRNRLLQEYRKCDKSFSGKNIEKVANKIENLQKQRKNIIEESKKKSSTPNKSPIITKQENKHKIEIQDQEKGKIIEKNIENKLTIDKKDQCLQTIIPEIENNKQTKIPLTSTTDTDYGSSEIIATSKCMPNQPFEIIIKVKNQIQKQKSKSPFKAPRKKSIERHGFVKKKTPPPKQSLTKHLMSTNINHEKKNDENSSATSYKSLPDKVPNSLREFLLNTEKSSKTSKQIENVIKGGQEHCKKTQKDATLKEKMNLDPKLKHHIHRLLGMSHHIVNLIGVNVSDIETPSSSIVNNSLNNQVIDSQSDSNSFEREKLERLKKFIEDNYQTLSEIEKSNSTNSNSKIFEQTWKESLGEQTKKSESKVNNEIKSQQQQSQIKAVENKFQSSRKQNSVTSKNKSHPNSLKNQSQPDSKTETQTRVTDIYNEFTENCSQRIAELNEMISKVREEKRKIVDATLSSGGDTICTTTEYDEVKKKSEQLDKIKIIDNKISSDYSPRKITQLEKNKVIGKSQDSGISLSRPITALGNNEATETQFVEEEYETILKDIPKQPPLPIIDTISTAPIDNIIKMDPISKKLKKEKPPVSLDRFSPQSTNFKKDLQQIPHELSTITEVDTSLMSRLNITVPPTGVVKHDAQESEKLHKPDKVIIYQNFPTFKEYVQQNKLDIETLDQEQITQMQNEYEKIINSIDTISVNGSDTGQSSFLINDVKNLIDALKLLNISFDKFPDRKEYLEKLKLSGNLLESIESKESDDNDIIKAVSDVESSGESLLDVVKELKRRKMMEYSFRSEARKMLSSSTDNDVYKISSTASEEGDKSTKISPKKMSMVIERNKPCSSSSTVSDNLEEELNNLGLSWAAAMIHKSQVNKRKNKDSSTSSSFSALTSTKMPKKQSQMISQAIKTELFTTSDSTFKDDNARPLNLRDFLAKELQKHKIAISSSSSSSKSLTTSSIKSILRSLLGSSNVTLSSSLNAGSGRGTRTENVRTSTPRNTQTHSSRQLNSDANISPKFFSNESHPSSVHYISSTSNTSNNDNN